MTHDGTMTFYSKLHIAPPVSIDAACLACPKRVNGTNIE